MFNHLDFATLFTDSINLLSTEGMLIQFSLTIAIARILIIQAVLFFSSLDGD